MGIIDRHKKFKYLTNFHCVFQINNNNVKHEFSNTNICISLINTNK